MTIELGTPAPTFNLSIAGGGRVSLADLKGRSVVVYFYPKADTPGCTTEGQEFSSRLPEFEALRATVIGVSRDSVQKLDRFRTKRDLKVILASDEDGTVTEAWGVWGEKQLYGRTYMGIERATFLIDQQGVVRGIWRKVKVAGHAQAVLDQTAVLSAG
jgi:Peroxiredoxin